MSNESADNKTQTAGTSEPVKPIEGTGQEAKLDASNGYSPNSVFVNSEPMREEQVQNAVKFLSHPKVRGSPVMYRRSFLEKKGLTREEIDEAFRRVPDPAPNTTTPAVATSSQESKLQVSTQAPAATAPIGAVPAASTLQHPRFHWSHAVLAVGVLAASGAGTAVLFKNMFVPRLKSWIRKVVVEGGSEKKDDTKPTATEEAAAAAKVAAAAATDIARASQEMLNSKNEDKKYFESLTSLLVAQVEEMKSMNHALRKLEAPRESLSSDKHVEEHLQYPYGNGPSNSTRRVFLANQEDPKPSYVTSKAKIDGMLAGDLTSGRPSSAPATMEPAPHPKSYMEIMAMVQRGEKPPGIREIDDRPPNPNQLPSNPNLAPRPKPWEVGQSSSYGFQSEMITEGSNFEGQENGHSSQVHSKYPMLSGDGSEPSWRQKSVRITEMEPNHDDRRTTYRSSSYERPMQRTWVPPLPPPVAMPEAAAAIRQPKSSVPKDVLTEEQLMKSQENGNDQVEQATKAPDSAAVVESFDGISGSNNSSEIQEIREDGIEVN